MNTREQVDAFNRDLAEVFAKHKLYLRWCPDFFAVANLQGVELAEIDIERNEKTVEVRTLEVWR